MTKYIHLQEVTATRLVESDDSRCMDAEETWCITEHGKTYQVTEPYGFVELRTPSKRILNRLLKIPVADRVQVPLRVKCAIVSLKDGGYTYRSYKMLDLFLRRLSRRRNGSDLWFKAIDGGYVSCNMRGRPGALDEPPKQVLADLNAIEPAYRVKSCLHAEMIVHQLLDIAPESDEDI